MSNPVLGADPEVAGSTDWFRENFATLPEADAFALGLSWGDEPQFSYDAVIECPYLPGSWDVVFCYMSDLPSTDEVAEYGGDPHGDPEAVAP